MTTNTALEKEYKILVVIRIADGKEYTCLYDAFKATPDGAKKELNTYRDTFCNALNFSAPSYEDEDIHHVFSETVLRHSVITVILQEQC